MLRVFTRILAVFFILISVLENTFTQRTCAHQEYLQFEQKENYGFAIRADFEESIKNWMKRNETNRDENITIPVVVHIVYNKSEENLSEIQIQSQIEALNRDFSQDPNSHWSQAANCNIKFALANFDPNGDITNGITRKYTSKTSFSVNNDIKFASSGGVNIWDSKSYLNIWVCDLAGAYLGYAQFPGGNAKTDGVVIDYKYFGTESFTTYPYNEGKTTTHEVGHWLGLDHIWGQGDCVHDDNVSDTPMSDGPNFGCAAGRVSCGSIDMVENYMDYSDDACMELFTQGQKERMRSIFVDGAYRHDILDSKALIKDTNENTDLCAGQVFRLDLRLDNYPTETSWSVTDENGEIVLSNSTYSNVDKGKEITLLHCLKPGCYDFEIRDKYADGICCRYGEGYFKATLDDILLTEGGEFKSSEFVHFCVEGNTEVVDESEEEMNHCENGIQDADESDIDCGGEDCEPCQESNVVLSEGFFENGMDGWIDGGTDCNRYYGTYSFENNYSIRLRDNSGLNSSMISETYNITHFQSFQLTFDFYPFSYEPNEGFRIYANFGSEWILLSDLISVRDFSNYKFYEMDIKIKIPSSSNTLKLKIESNGNSNSDLVYIDAVRVYASMDQLETDEITISEVEKQRTSNHEKIGENLQEAELIVMPNPVNEFLDLSSSEKLNEVKVFNLEGELILSQDMDDTNIRINTSELLPGAYILLGISDEETNSIKFVKY